MKEKKEFSYSTLFNLIAGVESMINGKELPVHNFIFLHKSYRFINLDSLKKSVVDKWDPGNKSSYLRLRPDSFKNTFRMLYQSVFNKIEIPSSADIILIRANVSLFYLDKGIRVKIFMPGGARSLPEFKNDFNIRGKIAESGIVNVPVLLDSNLQCEPYFFIDKIVFGDLLTSSHPDTPSVFKMIIPQMWKFYQSNGIVWSTLLEKGIDIDEKIKDYKTSPNGNIVSKFDPDLNKIREFDKKLIPCSLIHGDLSIKNIIITSGKKYIIDWETSRHDFIIYDFFKILLKEKWNLYEDIDNLMRIETQKQFGTKKNCALSLSEQIMLASFLVKWSGLPTPIYRFSKKKNF